MGARGREKDIRNARELIEDIIEKEHPENKINQGEIKTEIQGKIINVNYSIIFYFKLNILNNI